MGATHWSATMIEEMVAGKITRERFYELCADEGKLAAYLLALGYTESGVEEAIAEHKFTTACIEEYQNNPDKYQ